MTNTDEHQSNTDEQPLRCVLCGGRSRSPGPVRRLPAPSDPEVNTPMCVTCWAEAVGDEGLLSEAEATILACESVGFSPTFTQQITTFPKVSQQEKRKEAVQKLVDTRSNHPTRQVVAALDIPLPPQLAVAP